MREKFQIFTVALAALTASAAWLLFILTLFTVTAKAEVYSFSYANNMRIEVDADSKTSAYRLAAKKCFKLLTNNKYPGEEVGLKIIDICANPGGF